MVKEIIISKIRQTVKAFEKEQVTTEEEVPETFLGKIKFKIISMLHKVKSFLTA